MPTLLQRLLRRDFRDLSGLTISGSIPVNESLLNEVLAEALGSLAARDPSPRPSSPDTLDLAPLARLVKRAQVRIDAKVLTLDFELSAPPQDAPGQTTPDTAVRG